MTTTQVSQGDGQEEADGGEAHDGGQGTELCIQYMVLVTLSQHGYSLVFLRVRHMIKDSAKPIYIYKQICKTSSSFINICNSNYKVSTFAHCHRLT